MNSKYIYPLLLIFILLTACQNYLPSADPSTDESLPAENNSEDDSAVDPGNDISMAPDDAMVFCDLFPDPYFALEVAALFHKEATDAVTFVELAGYTGELFCGPGELESIAGIGYLTGLTSFSSAKNNLRELPPEIGLLTNLKSINLLKAYCFETIPPEIKNLKKLEFFRASLTSLNELPIEIGELTSLRILFIDNTQITSIPEEIGNLVNLEFLDMHSNDIGFVPGSICHLVKLEALDISYTKLNVLPEDIGNLVELKRLDLFGCNLRTFPESVKNLHKLRYLNVYDNFDLSEKYKGWFSKGVYECMDDPKNDGGWVNKWFYNQ